MLLTISSLAYADSEKQFEAYTNPLEYGIYVVDKNIGEVKFCSTIPTDNDYVVMACTPWSGHIALKTGEYNKWNR